MSAVCEWCGGDGTVEPVPGAVEPCPAGCQPPPSVDVDETTVLADFHATGGNGSEPAASGESGEPVLDEVSLFLGRFVAFPSAAAQTATVLWVAHAWMVHEFESTPRLALLSPEPGSGKTRVLEAVELLVPTPLHALNASVAAVFRMIRDHRPTLLLDEVDAVFRSSSKSEDGSEELRGVLNSGHRATATVPRCVGPTHEVQLFPVFCAVALAGLGDLPDTLMSRSVIIRMRRRAPSEKVEPLRHRLIKPEADQLHQRLQAWAEPVAKRCGQAFPTMPEGVTDRAADVWEPLLAVADAAGGIWPKLGREACAELNKVRDDAQTIGVKLLADVRKVMPSGAMSSADLAAKLAAVEEAPWGDWYGKPIDARWLATRLKPYGIAPTQIRQGATKFRGYRADDFADAWTRYLPPAETGTSETAGTEQVTAPPAVPDSSHVPDTSVAGRSGTRDTSGTEPTAATRDVPPVPPVPLFSEGPTP